MNRSPAFVNCLLMAVMGTTSNASKAADAAPVKIGIESGWQSVRAGQPVVLRVRLLDAANQPAAPSRRFDIQLQARLGSGEVRSLRTVTLRSGQREAQVSVTPPGPGLVYIWAKHAELLPGGVFVDVRGQAAPPPPPNRPPGRIPLASPAPSAPRSGRPPHLALRYSPDRRFLADGKDTATIQAFLLSDPAEAPGEIRLNVFDSSGTLSPVPLRIPKGAESGQSELTFDRPGKVTVEFLSSDPAAQLEGDRKLQIDFMPPVTQIRVEASPPDVSLVDTAEVVVTLADAQGRPVATDSPRPITFTIQSGRGEIARVQSEIAAGQFEARTTFRPVWLGRVEIGAATPNLLAAAGPVNVSVPTPLLLVSAAAGLAGGYFSYLKKRKRAPRRIWMGALTGFLFYWACLFAGLGAFQHGVVVNPLSAFALSMLGGWLQLDVFTILSSRLKVNP